MNRKLANWLAANPGGAALVTGLLGLLPLFGLGFAFFLPGAVPALLVLVRGDRIGLAVALGATLLLTGAMLALGRPVSVGLVYSAWILGPPLALGLLLRRTQSLSLCLQVTMIAGAVLVVLLHLKLGDPQQFWAPFVRDLAAEMEQRGWAIGVEEEGLVETFARTLWGWVALLTVLLALCALFLGRWWQSLTAGAGRFGAEFQQIRLGLALGVVAAIVVVLSLLTDEPLVDDMARLFVGALTIIGLAAAHRRKAQGGGSGMWLWVLYVMLVVAAPPTVAVLAAWGFVDNWLRSRTAVQRA
jgi:hypothetical protein